MKPQAWSPDKSKPQAWSPAKLLPDRSPQRWSPGKSSSRFILPAEEFILPEFIASPQKSTPLKTNQNPKPKTMTKAEIDKQDLDLYLQNMGSQ